MVDCLLDLVLRPGESSLPIVQVLLTAVASMGTLLGGDAPGEIDGHVVPAEMIRSLLRALAGIDARPDAAAVAGQDALWQQVDQEQLEAWLEEAEQRLLAGESGSGPAWPPDLGEPIGADEWPDTVEELVDPPPDRSPDEPEPTHDGWWRAADAAVTEAGTALREAEQAMSHARRMVRTARRADDLDEEVHSASAAGRVTDAVDALGALAAAAEGQREWLTALLSRTGGGGLAERPRIALTDALSGALVSLTDLPGMRRAGTCGAPACRRNPEGCTHDLSGRPGLTPPDPTDGYRPGAELDRWVRARDRRCRFPGCRRRVPRAGELDHDRPYPDGPTSAENLTGFCTSHHRGKHQAPGWRHVLAPDGTLTVVTPTGLTAVTTPPPY